MMSTDNRIRGDDVRGFLLKFSNRILETKDALNSMDAECGDGDFGSVMFIAFSNVRQMLEQGQSNDIGILLDAVGNSILSSAGGASGPLFGTLFIEAGKVAKGKKEADLADLAAMFNQSLQKIRTRGGANVGDKTLVDALEPAVNSLKDAAGAKMPLLLALRNATQAARAGCESTKRMIAKHGKARYLGEQTLGYADPGANVIALIFETLAASIRSEQESNP